MPHRLTSEEALEVLDVMDVAVMIADIINGGSWVTWVNPAFTRVFGYTLEEMIDGAVHRIIGANTDKDEIERMYAEVRKGNRSTITSVGYCADGSELWSTFTASPVFAAGRVVRWISVQHDVSEHVRRSERERRSYEIERRARIGLSVVGEVSDVMADVDDPLVLRAVVQLLRRRLVSWAGFFVVDGTELRELEVLGAVETRRHRASANGFAGADADPVIAASAGEEIAHGYVDLNRDYPPGTPAAELVTRLRQHRAMHPVAADRAVVVPVVGRRRPLCVLVVLPRSTDARVAASAGEIATILELVARRVGLAMENAQLYAREHRLAETLQRAMLPEQAHVADLDVWTYYAPNVEHAQVGGDWYDVVHLAGGAVGVVVGDVTGHDVEAAAAMGQLRSVVRAYADELVEPATVLSRVDSLLARMRFSHFATLVYATMTPDAAGWTVSYTLAGHLPPLLVRDGEVQRLAGASGLLLGCGTPERASAGEHVRAGDILVFYTDGLVERRDRSMRDGVDDLVEQCRHLAARDAAGVGEELVARLGDAPEDDVAVVVVRVPDPVADAAGGATPRSRRWQLPADRRSIGRARHAVLGTCAAWGIEQTQAVELVVSELVANAVVHGSGKVGLHFEDADHGLRVEVTDSNPIPPSTRRGPLGRLGGFGMHIVDRLAAWGWQPTPEGKLVWAVLRPGERGLPPSVDPAREP